MKSLRPSIRVPITGTIVTFALLGGLGVPMASAAAPDAPNPVRVVHTSHGTVLVYDTQQVLAQSGITTKVATSDVVARTTAPGIPGPDAVDTLHLHTTINIVYFRDHFECAYGTATATATPPADMELVGGLYYGSAQIDSFNVFTNGFQGTLADETACLNDGDATGYEMISAAVADFPDGGALDVPGSAGPLQP